MLTIAVIIDRDHGRDLDKLIVGLQNESELITHHANPLGRSCMVAYRLSAINNAATYRSHARARPTSLCERTAVLSDIETRRCHRRLLYMAPASFAGAFAADPGSKRMLSILVSDVAIFASCRPLSASRCG